MRALLFIVFCFLATPVLAQTSTTATATEGAKLQATPPPKPKAPPGFEPIAGKGKRAERVNANVLVAISYGSIFTLLIGYLFFLIRDHRRISEEQISLQQKIAAEKSTS